MGFGKSGTALYASQLKKAKKVLIVVKAKLIPNWEEEISKWVDFKTPYKIVSYHFYTKLDTEPLVGFDFIIFDEAHHIKTFSGKATTAWYKFMFQNRQAHIVFMSATPKTRLITDYWRYLKVFHHKYLWENYEIKTQEHFLNYFCSYGRENGLFRNQYQQLTETIVIRVNEFEKLLKHCFLQRFLVPKGLEYIFTKVAKKEAKKLAALEMELWEELQEENAAVRDKRRTMRREIGMVKVPCTAKRIDELMESEPEHLVVFSYHKVAQEALKLLLKKHNVFVVNGNISADKRFEIIKKFKKEGGILLATIPACKEGYNFEFVQYVVFHELATSPEDNAQALGRLLRRTQKGEVTCEVVIVPGSYDDRIIKLNDSKKSGNIYKYNQLFT